MKHFITVILISATVMLILPVALLKDRVKAVENVSAHATSETATETESEKADTLAVFRSSSKETQTIEFFEYVCGSVAAEMPASYHEEALKAQAVACYTNAYRLKTKNTESGYDITDDSGTHQGYLNKDERKKKWGDDYEKYEKKIETAVKEVENEAIFYNDEPCIAAFFAICNGTTENAENIWGEKVPYLVSVKSNGDTLSPQYSTSVSFDKDGFLKQAEALGIKTDNIKSLKDILKITDATKAGTVLTATINGKKVSGDEIRKAFSLRSTVFTAKCEKSSIIFNVKGYGHGIGMSQYGADFMARQGSTYDEILKHYYKGVTIKNTEK